MTTVHVYPDADLIEHVTEGDGCLCGPTTEPVPREDGSYGWLLIHHSLDGRENREKTPVNIPEKRPQSDAEVIHQDLCRILDALGLDAGARPYSPHEVVVRDIVPAIEALRGQRTRVDPAARLWLFFYRRWLARDRSGRRFRAQLWGRAADVAVRRVR